MKNAYCHAVWADATYEYNTNTSANSSAADIPFLLLFPSPSITATSTAATVMLVAPAAMTNHSEHTTGRILRPALINFLI